LIWVYAICDKPELPPPRRRGLAQAPLEGLREGHVLAVITRHAESVCEPAPDALWMHERVVEWLMADRTVLPMRFGSKVDDDDALRTTLADRQNRFLAALAHVNGRVELGLRALQAVSEPVAAINAASTSGRDYLLAKLRDGDTASALHAPLAELAVATSRQLTRGDDEILHASYLVERAAVERFRGAVERLQRAHTDVSILCTGPWPPYSFVQ
jgi:hypothetical protein